MRPAWIASCGLPAAVVARGLRPDLQHLAVPLDRVAQLDGLLDGVRHRLFDIDVLAGRHGVDGDLAVPVVGRGDQHGVDVVAFEQLAIVEIAFAAADVLGSRETPLIDIANGDDLQIVGLGA